MAAAKQGNKIGKISKVSSQIYGSKHEVQFKIFGASLTHTNLNKVMRPAINYFCATGLFQMTISNIL